MVCAALNNTFGAALTAHDLAVLQSLFQRIGSDTNAINGVLISIGSMPIDRLDEEVVVVGEEEDPVYVASYAHMFTAADNDLLNSFTTNDVAKWNETTNSFCVTNTAYMDTVITNVSGGITNLYKYSRGLLYEIETLSP